MSEIKAAVSTVKKETESKQASVVIQNKDKQITDSYKEFRHSLLQL